MSRRPNSVFRPLVAVLLLAAAAGAGVYAVRERRRMTASAGARSLLASAQRDRRAVEGRLTRGFPFARYPGPLHAPERGPQRPVGDPGGAAPNLGEAAAAVLEAAAERPSAESFHDLGVLRLVQGRYRLAAEALERAVRLAPDDAKLRSDLATAYLEEGSARGVPHLFSRALALADEAIGQDPALVEAWFNRAVALERLSLLPAAWAAWHDYLARDAYSPWAEEARRRLCEVEAEPPSAAWEEARPRLEEAAFAGDEAAVREVVAEHPLAARRFAIDELTAGWPEAERAADAARVERSLRAVRTLGATLSVTQNDHFLRDAADDVDAARGEARGVRAAALAAAYGELALGQEAYAAQDVARAASRFERARSAFARAGHEPGELVAEYELARCDVYAVRYEAVLARLGRAIAVAEGRDYLHLVGRMRWVSGYAHLLRFDVEESLRDLRLAARYLEAAGDPEALVTVNVLLAQAYNWLGSRDDAWRYAHRAFATSATLGLANQRPLVFTELSHVLVADDQLVAARYLLDSAVDLAAARGDASFLVGALGKRAVLLSRAGRRAEAVEALDEAAAYAASIRDPLVAARTSAELAIARAEALVEQEPADAVERIDDVLALYSKTSDRLRLARCYRLRARAYRGLGDDERAGEDLARCLEEYELERGKLPGPDVRVGFFESPQDAFDEMIAFQVERRDDAAEAFRYAEMARARGLLDEVGRRSDRGIPAPLGLDAVRRYVPEGAALVEYAVLPESLYAWVVRRDGYDFVRVSVGAAEVASQVERVLGAVEGGDAEEVAALSRPLYDWLWREVAPLLPPGATVVIVPDEALDRLPFGVLYDEAAGRYLVEDRALAKAPSASVFAAADGRGAALSAPGEVAALVVGDPQYDRMRFPELGGLPNAEREAREVAALYPGATLLVRAQATGRAFSEAAARSSVVHYAGHAVLDERLGAEPALVLAADVTEPGPLGGALTAADVAALELPATRLVVLAACETAGGRQLRGEGSAGLARAFLSAGVPSVVASRWSVDDRVTSEIFPVFHGRLRAGDDPASALRAAVLHLFERRGRALVAPKDWAAFELYGGVSTRVAPEARR